jgi:DNA-binding FadR family transcriptional regulator
MQQLRQILEPEAAALAAENHTAAQLAEIEAAYNGMRDSQSFPDWNAADVKFHLAILFAAGNELLVPLGFVIESALGNMFDWTTRHNEDFRSALPLHEHILVAIRQRKPEAARRAVRKLLGDTNRVIGLARDSTVTGRTSSKT